MRLVALVLTDMHIPHVVAAKWDDLIPLPTSNHSKFTEHKMNPQS